MDVNPIIPILANKVGRITTGAPIKEIYECNLLMFSCIRDLGLKHRQLVSSVLGCSAKFSRQISLLKSDVIKSIASSSECQFFLSEEETILLKNFKKMKINLTCQS
ncbi:hypothetical protein BGC07_16340 [Piscirickettsia litoralis]|uniref:Uncharacterized protein n=1 Tax=Piscirickettsia litoralis TaxID=1891921 RepID=A0ABX3A5G2_9GAMM|nr:hypothetical protein BGC07_16340 [Piscirickettsia litoralis]